MPSPSDVLKNIEGSEERGVISTSLISDDMSANMEFCISAHTYLCATGNFKSIVLKPRESAHASAHARTFGGDFESWILALLVGILNLGSSS